MATSDKEKRRKKAEHLRGKTHGCKRGARSDRETELLHQYISEGKNIEEIAALFNRNVPTVSKWLEELHLESIGANPLEVKKILDNLKKSHFWPEVCQQFTSQEVKYFEGEWISLMLQFQDEGILSSEILSLKQLVTINILINRSMKERKKHLEEIEKLQKELSSEYDKGDFKDTDRITMLEQSISFARSAVGQYTGEYTKLLDQQKTINKDLKATRDQRIKKIEDSKANWSGLLRLLEEEEYRRRVGYDAEINRIAKDKAKKELGQYITFDNGEVDKPLLNADTVEDEE